MKPFTTIDSSTSIPMTIDVSRGGNAHPEGTTPIPTYQLVATMPIVGMQQTYIFLAPPDVLPSPTGGPASVPSVDRRIK